MPPRPTAACCPPPPAGLGAGAPPGRPGGHRRPRRADGGFTVHGDTRTTDTLTAGLGFALTRGRHFVLFARYGLEYRRDFSGQTLAAGMDYRF